MYLFLYKYLSVYIYIYKGIDWRFEVWNAGLKRFELFCFDSEIFDCETIYSVEKICMDGIAYQPEFDFVDDCELSGENYWTSNDQFEMQ